MKSIIKSIAVAALAVMSTACLELDPKDQLADGNLWERSADFENFANQFYGWTADFSSYVNDGPHSDKRSDINCDKASKNVYSNGTYSVPNSDSNYSSGYAHIRRCNILIEQAAGYPQADDIRQYVGEAYFFRAYSYFHMMQMYGDLIIVDHTIDVDDALMSATRNDRTEVADFIIADLNQAISYLKKFDEVPYGRISLEGAQAFLSRVALYEGTWQKFRGNTEKAKTYLNTAAQAAKQVIDANTFQLFTNDALGASAYRYMFVLENEKSNPANVGKNANKEYIFARCHDEVLKPIGFNISYGHCNNADWASKKFADLFLCDDGLPIEVSTRFQGYDKQESEWQNRDARMGQILIPAGAKLYCAGYKPQINWDGTDPAHVEKYAPTNGTGYSGWKWVAERDVVSTKEGFDYPIIRYAEVLLNYAEAVYERDDKISDADLAISINLTRKRINDKMPDLTNAFVSANGLNMRTEIRRERTIELFEEGFRMDDIKRWKTAETEMPMAFMGNKHISSGSHDADGFFIYESADDRHWEDKHYLYPLPVDQRQLNPNLGQNPGWAN